MRNLVISFVLGVAAAAIDVAPMIARKMDGAFIASAACMWIVLGLLIPAARIVPTAWLNGALVALMCALPVVILVARLDRQAIPVILVTTAVLGAAIGVVSSIAIR